VAHIVKTLASEYWNKCILVKREDSESCKNCCKRTSPTISPFPAFLLRRIYASGQKSMTTRSVILCSELLKTVGQTNEVFHFTCL